MQCTRRTNLSYLFEMSKLEKSCRAVIVFFESSVLMSFCWPCGHSIPFHRPHHSPAVVGVRLPV
jgi:hypothetical protein